MVQTSHAITAMSLFSSFGFEELARRLLTQNGVHHLSNLLSLDPNCHGYFDKLNLWFERTDVVCHLKTF